MNTLLFINEYPSHTFHQTTYVHNLLPWIWLQLCVAISSINCKGCHLILQRPTWAYRVLPNQTRTKKEPLPIFESLLPFSITKQPNVGALSPETNGRPHIPLLPFSFLLLFDWLNGVYCRLTWNRDGQLKS